MDSNSISNDSLILQNKIMSFQAVIALNDNYREVKTWYNQVRFWKKLNNVQDKEELFGWCKSKVTGIAAKALFNLIDEDEENITYPTLEEMVAAIKKAYRESDYITNPLFELKQMKIQKNENLKKFNKKFYELYDDLEPQEKLTVSYFDYANAIEAKEEAWKGVQLLDPTTDIKKAMEVAEKYENLALRLQARNITKSTKRNISLPMNNQRNFNINNNLASSEKKGKEPWTNSKNDNNGKAFNIQTCYFCSQTGHRKYECPQYNRYEYLKFQELVRNARNVNDNTTSYETTGSRSPLN